MSIIVIFTDTVGASQILGRTAPQAGGQFPPGLPKIWDRPDTVRSGPEYLAELVLIDASGKAPYCLMLARILYQLDLIYQNLQRKQMICWIFRVRLGSYHGTASCVVQVPPVPFT